MRFRLDILLFSVLVFFLTAVGLAFLVYDWLESTLWLTFAYVVVWALALGFAFEILVGRGRLSGERFVLLAFVVVLVSALVMHSSWTIVTPRWSLSISTDKPAYSLGETVEITVCLTNNGFITHSFRSEVDCPAVVRIRHRAEGYTVWYSACHWEDTYFSVGPNQDLQRIFVWIQTGYAEYIEIPPGEYSIVAETSACLPERPLSATTHVKITTT